MSGFISPKRAINRGCIHEYFRVPIVGILRLVEEVFCSALIAPGAYIILQPKEKMSGAI